MLLDISWSNAVVRAVIVVSPSFKMVVFPFASICATVASLLSYEIAHECLPNIAVAVTSTICGCCDDKLI